MADEINTSGSASNEDENNATLAGERGIASITEGGGQGLSDKHKKIIAAVILVFLGALAYMSWPRDDAPIEEETQTETTTRIRTSQNFQPAEIVDPEPEPVVKPEVQPEPERPLGPIERARLDAGQEGTALTEAEQLLESSKRAPLMAYAGNQISGEATSPSATSGEGGSFFGGGEAAPLTGLAADLVSGARGGAKATLLENPHLTITQGTIIPCALDTALDSTAPGMVRCTVTDDVYSTTGSVILLDRGTRIVGEYRGGVQRGQKRIFVIWNRAETPTGVIVNLASPASDGLGRSGFTGDIDTQFWTRFGGTMMLSIIDTALIALADQNEDNETTSNNVSELAQTELDSVIDVPVIMRKNQGEEVAVMVARDLDFSGVYRLK